MLVTPCFAESPVILILGDSLSAGYGIDTEDTWVRALAQRLGTEGYPHRVVNASISGDTSSGGRQRLPALLERHRPAVVIIELGGNDGLRGIALEELEANLTGIIESAKASGAQALLLRMELPPNYGPAYLNRFRQVFVDVGRATQSAVAPFLLDGVALNTSLMQADGIHPRAEAAARMLDNIWPSLTPLLSAR